LIVAPPFTLITAVVLSTKKALPDGNRVPIASPLAVSEPPLIDSVAVPCWASPEPL
jgi:hypothetical protein